LPSARNLSPTRPAEPGEHGAIQMAAPATVKALNFAKLMRMMPAGMK